MRQRAVIAMALACDPKVLFADEPTTALDVVVQAQIGDLLAELTERLGLALVMVTHDIGMIAETCRPGRGHVRRASSSRTAARSTCSRRRATPTRELLLEATPVVNRDRPLVCIPGTPPRLDEPIERLRLRGPLPARLRGLRRAAAAARRRPPVACHARRAGEARVSAGPMTRRAAAGTSSRSATSPCTSR